MEAFKNPLPQHGAPIVGLDSEQDLGLWSAVFVGVWFVLGAGVLHVQLRYRDGTVVKINTVKRSGVTAFVF